MGRKIGHAPSAARWTKTSHLAAERNHPIHRTLVTTHTDKAVLRLATAQESAQTVFAPEGQGMATTVHVLEEGLQMIQYGLEEHRCG
jgi:hypothetical protein